MKRRGLLLAAAGSAMARPRRASAAASGFPAGFVWGASTSAYQIEGAAAEDGRGPSIWDIFSHTPGRIADGSNGDVACDHYHRMPDDLALLAEAGFGAYRFSICWSRVLPDGAGDANPRGLDFYDRLADRLLAAGVAPWACLFHWDLPQALQARGGWSSRDSAAWFADYALLMAGRLGDRVKHWAMLNEPSVHAIFGHAIGNHAPGLKGWANYVAAQHHQNLAQGMALSALRSHGGDLVLGTVFSLQPVHPATERQADRDAAARFDAVWNRANLDPLFLGRYPDLLGDAFAPLTRAGDLDAIRQKVDFLGVNYYGRAHVVDDPKSVLRGAAFGPLPPGTPTTAMGWPVEPDGLVEQLLDLKARYGSVPLYITENGACYDDPLPVDGVVEDPQRVDFLRAHVQACRNAITHGADLRGYFVWSLLDNFEWAEGFRRRFGIVRVDFDTLRRTPKSSFHYLSKVARGAD